MTIDHVEIGALGWTHPGWDNDYYPEDLPEDWRLDYYSHHFQCVVMQTNEWQHSSDDDIGQWLEDVKDSFDFFLLWEDGPSAVLIEQIARIKNILAERLLGVLIMHNEHSAEAAVLQQLSALTAVYMDTDADLSHMPEIRPCWRMGREVTGCCVGFIDENASKDMRNMRACIEAFIQQGGEQQLYLVYQGSPPSTKAMQDAQLILQMLV